jgi:hypothetical protein
MAIKVSALLATTLLALAGSVQAAQMIDVYKSPSCGCCGKWIEHLKKAGFKVETHEVTDIPGNRKKLGMPDKFGSCHSAKVGNYVLEGHVPAADIQRLLKEKPKALGIAVPAMPPGSPGMDIPNSPPYETLLVQTDGSSRVFAKH